MANVAASTTPNKESPTPNISSATENGGDGESIENDQTSEAHAVAGAVDASPAVPAASDLESVEVDEDEEDDSTSKLEFSASCFPALMGHSKAKSQNCFIAERFQRGLLRIDEEDARETGTASTDRC